MKKRIFALALVVGVLLMTCTAALADTYYVIDSVTPPTSPITETPTKTVSATFTVSIGTTTSSDDAVASLGTVTLSFDNSDNALSNINFPNFSVTASGDYEATLSGTLSQDGSVIVYAGLRSGDVDYSVKSASVAFKINTFSISITPSTTPVILGIGKTYSISLTPSNAAGTVSYTYTSSPSGVSVDFSNNEATITSQQSEDIYTVTITAKDEGRSDSSSSQTVSIKVIVEDNADIRNPDSRAWNGIDPLLPVSGDQHINNVLTGTKATYEKAKPKLGKINKSDLTFEKGTPAPLVIPIIGPVKNVNVYVAAKDAIKLGWQEKGKTAVFPLNKENIKKFTLPFRVTSYDFVQEVESADKKAQTKAWKKVENQITISFNGGNFEYKGFPLTIELTPVVGDKKVKKTLKLNVGSKADWGTPHWVKLDDTGNYVDYAKKDKPEAATWVDKGNKKTGKLSKDLVVSTDYAAPMTITATPYNDAKGKTKLAKFFKTVDNKTVFIEQTKFDYLGNIEKGPTVQIYGEPKETGKESKLSLTFTATNPSTKKKASLKATAIGKLLPLFEADGKKITQDKDGDKKRRIVTKPVVAGKVPSVKFKATGSKTISYHTNASFDEELAKYNLALDSKKGSIIATVKNATTPTLNANGEYEPFAIMVSAENGVKHDGDYEYDGHIVWASIDITGAVPKIGTTKAFTLDPKNVSTYYYDKNQPIKVKIGSVEADETTDSKDANVRFSVTTKTLSEYGLELQNYDEILVASAEITAISDSIALKDDQLAYKVPIYVTISDEAMVSKEVTVSAEVQITISKDYSTDLDLSKDANPVIFVSADKEANLYLSGDHWYASGDNVVVTIYSGDKTIKSGDKTVKSGDKTVQSGDNSIPGTVVSSSVTYKQSGDKTIVFIYTVKSDDVNSGDVSFDKTYPHTIKTINSVVLSGDKTIVVDYIKSEPIGAKVTVASLKNQAVIQVTDIDKFMSQAKKIKKSQKLTVSFKATNLGAESKVLRATLTINKLEEADSTTQTKNSSAKSIADAAGSVRNGKGSSGYDNDGSVYGEKNKSETEAILTIGAPRTIANLTAAQMAYLEAMGYRVIAVLPEISATGDGQQDIDVELDEDAPDGEKMIYVPFPKDVPEVEDDSIVDFYDAEGAPIEEVPAEKAIVAAPWLRADVVYEPVIAVKE